VVEDEDLTERLKEAAYTAVGLGILGVQRLQVQRRTLAKQVQPQVREAAVKLRVSSRVSAPTPPTVDRPSSG